MSTEAVPSNQIVRSLPVERVGTNAGSTAVLTMKEVIMEHPGTYRFVFSIRKAGGIGATVGQIYRNDVAVGILRSVSASANPSTFIEDIPGWVKGDIAQLKANDDAANSNLRVSGFHIYGSLQEVPPAIPSRTKTDANNAG